MTLSLTIAGSNKISVLRWGSLKLKSTADGHQGVADFTLNDFTPTNGDTVVIADGATTYYSGYVRSLDVDEYKVGRYFCKVSCQDDAVAFASLGAAPFAFSDTPNNVTTFAYERLSIKRESANNVGTSISGTVVTRKDGLKAGQQLTVTSANHGLSAQVFNIVELDVSFEKGKLPEYTARIGDSPIRLIDAIQGTIDTAVGIAAEGLAISLKTPKVVTVLPDLPSGTYPEGTLVYLTTDGKIYRSLGDIWSKSVDGADLLVASITAGAIQAGAIGAEALAATIVLASTIKTAEGPDRVEIDNTGLHAYLNDVLTAEIGAEGITADSLRIGNLAGGHNNINNSSFELSDFITVATSITFTDTTATPGWKAANRTTALDNITESTSLSATTLAY